MFTVVSKHLFWWPVDVKRPDPEKPGSFLVDRFHMQFRALPMDEARGMDDARAQSKAAGSQDINLDFFFTVCVGWRDVVDEDKAAVAFSRDVLHGALQHAWFRDAVIAAYAGAMAGQEARLGN